jgi:microcystin-dependent protein
MKRIDFTNINGLPFDQDLLDFMQQAYVTGMAALASMVGELSIISGVAIAGGNVTSGYVSIAGEVIPFVAGPYFDKVEIVTTVTDLPFEDTQLRPVLSEKVARCAAIGDYDFTSFKRVRTLSLLQEFLVPTGSILPFGGALDKVPSGWLHVNGQVLNIADYSSLFSVIGNTYGGDGVNTFALPESGRLFMNLKPGDLQFGSIGQQSGSLTKNLLPSNLPRMQLDVPLVQGNTSASDSGSGRIAMGGDGNDNGPFPTLKTSYFGNDEPFSTLPPVTAIPYIIKY